MNNGYGLVMISPRIWCTMCPKHWWSFDEKMTINDFRQTQWAVFSLNSHLKLSEMSKHAWVAWKLWTFCCYEFAQALDSWTKLLRLPFFARAHLLYLKLWLFCDGAPVVFGHCKCRTGTFSNATARHATTMAGWVRVLAGHGNIFNIVAAWPSALVLWPHSESLLLSPAVDARRLGG